MSKLAGYIIVKGEEPEIEVYCGNHWKPTDESTGPFWMKVALGEWPGMWEVYSDHIRAEEVRRIFKLHDARIEPVAIGRDFPARAQRWEAFRDLCDRDLEPAINPSGPTLSTEHDECAAQLFGSNQAAFAELDNSGMLVELLETGSLTVRVGDRSFVISLDAQEES